MTSGPFQLSFSPGSNL